MMNTQPSLFDQIEAEAKAKQDFHLRQRQRRDNRWWAQWHPSTGYSRYNPRLLKQLLLDAIGEEWIGFTDLCRITNMSPDAINHMLDRLMRWGFLEETSLYYHRENPGLIEVNRLERPVGYYWGFEFGYRLKTQKASSIPESL